QGKASDATTGSTVPAASSPRSPSICTGELDRTTRKASAGRGTPANNSEAWREIRVLGGSVRAVVAIDRAAVERSSTLKSAEPAAGFCSASARNWPGPGALVKKAPVKVWGEKIGSVLASKGFPLRPKHAARR